MHSLNDLQTVELEILAEFKNAAESKGLKWFVMFGTLLGAVRRQGFIPWDDDIDVVMPRKDYDRLRLSQGWFKPPYFLQTPHNDPGAAQGIVRLRRDDTAVMAGFPNHLTRGGHMGAYIDVIPLDDVPDGETARELCKAAGSIRLQMLASAALDECGPPHISREKEYFCYGAGGIAGAYLLLADRHEALCSGFSGAPYYAMPAISAGRGARVNDKQWFKDCVEMSFEGITVPAPCGFREALVAAFPDGLHEPHGKARKPEHTADCTVDTGRSYKEYLARYTDMLREIAGKKILLFGAGDSLRIWLERYGSGLDIVCVFDNSKEKWGQTVFGLTVHAPAELPGFVSENTRLIITSIYHREISLQLDELGISDYYIFIDGFGYRRGE